MKRNSPLVLAAVASVFAMGAAQASDSARHEAQAIEKAKISLTEAIHIAERQGNGQATSAEYEFKNGNPAYYEVNVLRNDGHKLTKYELSPSTGAVKEKSDANFEKLFTRLKPTAIQNAPTSLTRAISTAETRTGGKAKEAEVKRDGDQLLYKVEVVKLDGTSSKLEINGSDGKVASAD
ncbi:MAG: PepSY domain-containing protein [Proteobacteria bacterium]|nr:PepSY domain-containing protein [Pseudomonadota bacterium]